MRGQGTSAGSEGLLMATYYSDMVNRPTCVYRAYDEDGELLYVGISMNLEGRLAKHRVTTWWPEVDEITVKWFSGREAAKAAERAAIRNENPRYNVARPISEPRIRVVE
jgi:excinuclease UvrABC nuclease subunit